MVTYISKSEQDTISFAKDFASKLKKGDIIVLSGELGSGKTKFVQGILEYFGLSNEISSPTFTIVNEHKKNDINIYHFDVYRLADIDEFFAMGGDEYFLNRNLSYWMGRNDWVYFTKALYKSHIPKRW